MAEKGVTDMPRTSVFAAVIAACDAARIQAEACRDGTGTARISVVIDVLARLANAVGDRSPRSDVVFQARQEAHMTRRFTAIHDRAARGELGADAYEWALAHERGYIEKMAGA